MLSNERPFTNRGITAVAIMFALAVTVFLAMAVSAKAADSPIKSAEFIPASETIKADSIHSKLSSGFDDVDGGYSLDQFHPVCLPDELKDSSTLKPASFGEGFLISTNDRLVITREDGSQERLSPRYATYLVNSGEFNVYMVWMDEDDKVTDVVTKFKWDKVPPLVKNNFFTTDIYKKGTYKNTVTVTVSEEDVTKSTTFKKTIQVAGNNLTKYDKKYSKINYKKIVFGKSYNGDKTGCDFIVTWPKVKSANYYVAKVKQIYPVGQTSDASTFSGKYKTATDYIRTKTPKLNTKSCGDDNWHTEYGDASVLSSDTMWQFKVMAMKKSKPAKTGAEYVYGPYSKQVNLFLSKNKSLKATGKKKSVKLTWNKIAKATGYKIKYSKKKNMSKAKTITVKGANRTSYTVKKLKKKTKYYFQVRPFKVYKKVTYNGFNSVKKAAKTK